jgi:hypothetical protein
MGCQKTGGERERQLHAPSLEVFEKGNQVLEEQREGGCRGNQGNQLFPSLPFSLSDRTEEGAGGKSGSA